MNLTIHVFSKDRAAQLDACLSSIERFVKSEAGVVVQYTSTSIDHETAYQRCSDMHPSAIFIRESSFSDTMHAVQHQSMPLYLPMVDDSLFIREFALTDEIIRFLQVVPSYSIRHHDELNYCQPADKMMVPPVIIYKGASSMSWEWTSCDPHTCWGYPHSFDRHIYRRATIIDLFRGSSPRNVNSAEAHIISSPPGEKTMAGAREQLTIGVQANFVNGRAGVETASPSFLLSAFLSGKRIDIDRWTGKTFSSAHIEDEITFK